MANEIFSRVQTEADARRVLRRFQGRPIDSLTRQNLQLLVVAQSKLIPAGVCDMKLGDIKGE